MSNALAADLAGALDPVQLAARTGLEADPWQADALRSEDPRLSLVVHRQGGKSSIVGVKCVHKAVYKPEALVLMFGPSQRQANELFRKTLACYRTIGRPVVAEAENVTTLQLENGSRIVSLPGNEATTRGFSAPDLIVIDEAARVPDAVFRAISPMLAVSGGQLIALSTPWGKRGWFYETTRNPSWRTISVPATACPRISVDFLESERRLIGDIWFKSEYLVEFVDALGTMFRTDDIEAIFAAGHLGAELGAPLFGAAAGRRQIGTARPALPAEVVEEEPWMLGSGKPLPVALARELNGPARSRGRTTPSWPLS